MNGRSLAHPRGRVLGGSSSISGMIYMPGQRRDYNEWKRLGNPGWGWDDVEGEAALIQAAGDIRTSIFRPIGTCRMGADGGAVVDARLRVHGVSGVRVVEASVMPTITSGNTNSPPAMIAEKAAHIIFEDHRWASRSSESIRAHASSPST